MKKLTQTDIIKIGQEVVSAEAEGLLDLQKSLDKNFSRTVELVAKCKGKIILCGVGKSGIIASKISATMNSTGICSVLLHPLEALHGDIGVVRKDDLAIMLSKSGNTQELKNLVPALKKIGVKIVSITSTEENFLSQNSDTSIYVPVRQEACLLGLAPTTSTTLMLAIGDAIAVAAYRLKGFTVQDFANTHPAGNLGKKLLLTLGSVMRSGRDIPTVQESANLQEVIMEISKKRIGATLVVGKKKLVGIITDGDIRRCFQAIFDKNISIKKIKANQIMTPSPVTTKPDTMGISGLEIMEAKKITHLPVVDANETIIGIVHIYDLIEELA